MYFYRQIIAFMHYENQIKNANSFLRFLEPNNIPVFKRNKENP